VTDESSSAQTTESNAEPDGPRAALDDAEARRFSDQMIASRIMLPCLADGCDWAMVIGQVLPDDPELPGDPACATYFLECIRYGKSRSHLWSGFASLADAKEYARATPAWRTVLNARRRPGTA